MKAGVSLFLNFRVKAPVIISQNAGDQADSNFTVSVVKINEEPFTTSYVRLGRLIKLKAEMTGKNNLMFVDNSRL